YAGDTLPECFELTLSLSELKWKISQPRDETIYTSFVTRHSTKKSVEKWFWSKKTTLSTCIFGKIMSEIAGLSMKFLHLK
ncbi:hypothetical protein AVEN_256280-1, partial [Araneus ventricosus]